MNHGHQTYSNVKPSGLEWVGDIPADWKVMPFFVHAPQSNVSNRGMVEQNLLSLSYGSVVRRSIDSAQGLLPASFETYQIVERNDIIFRLTDLQNDWRSLRSARCSERGIITSAYLAVTSRDISPRYFAFLMRSYDLSKVFYGMGSGLRQSLKYSDMKRLPLLIPPSGEQKQIASFLDYETAKIDALIEKQQQLIALLAEKRQAVISHAVTKGLNPDAPVKPSGIPWVRDIPKHWKVSQARYEFDVLDGMRVPVSVEERGKRKGQYPYYGASGIIDSIDDYIFDEPLVLVCEDGWNLHLRSQPVARPVAGKIWVNNHAHILRPRFGNTVVHAEILEVTPFSLFVTGTRQPKLTIAELKSVPMAVPTSETEFNELKTFIEETSTKFDALEAKAEAAVELLRERRTALISAAVTGKIDVRDWKPPATHFEHEAEMEVA